jgi:hypothetical protein
MFDKNKNYAVSDIAYRAFLHCPGRWKHEGSAADAINTEIKRLGIVPVNGLKKSRVFSGNDAQLLFNTVTSEKKERAQIHLQFDEDSVYLSTKSEAFKILEKRSKISGKSRSTIAEELIITADQDHPLSKYAGWTAEEMMKELEARDASKIEVYCGGEPI